MHFFEAKKQIRENEECTFGVGEKLEKGGTKEYFLKPKSTKKRVGGKGVY